MDNFRLFNEVKKHSESLTALLEDCTDCCTTSQLCRKVLDAAMSLVKPVYAIPLTQLVMSTHCAKKNHVNATLADVAFYQHELAVAYINDYTGMDSIDKSICKDLCKLVHMHVDGIEEELVWVA